MAVYNDENDRREEEIDKIYGRDVADPVGQRGDRRRNAVDAWIDRVIGLMPTNDYDAERCGINAAAAAGAVGQSQRTRDTVRRIRPDTHRAVYAIQRAV